MSGDDHADDGAPDRRSDGGAGEPSDGGDPDLGGGRLTRRRALVAAALGGAGAFALAPAASNPPSGREATGSDPDAARSGQESTTPDGHGSHPARTPPVDEIPPGGFARNFELVSHVPLVDDHQFGDHEPLGIPRGSNGDITIAGDYVYVGSFVGHQPPLIVDVSDPRNPDVVGPVPDAVPGVGNGIEGIEASGDLLVVDQREALGGLGFETPDDLPSRGLAVYDISNPRTPRLVARHGFADRKTHTVSLWRDPADPDRVLALESFTGGTDIAVVDLSGCPGGDCEPEVVATWDLRAQTPGRPAVTDGTHEAIFSTDGRRIYVAQLESGVFLLDSSDLVRALREDGANCDPAAPGEPEAGGHCLTLLNPDVAAREDTAPPLDDAIQHTPLKVPDRPYLLALAERTGPTWDDERDAPKTANCPGAFTRVVYVGEDEYRHHPEDGGGLMRGDLHPETVGVFGLPEQQLENCGPNGWKPGTAALPAWFSPHQAVVFPSVAFVSYYGAGLRAIDISNPFSPEEAGYFFNDPVDEVRWASYGIRGDTERDEDGHAVRQPAPGPNHMFAFSYPVVHDGHVIYADVHSGLYVLRYTGPHADELPAEGNAVGGNPGAVEPGYEPCPPYGQTEWGTPGQ